jgi:hypothetical protein
MGPNWMLTRSSVFLVHNGQFTRPEYSPRKDVSVGMQFDRLRAELSTSSYWLNCAVQPIASAGGAIHPCVFRVYSLFPSLLYNCLLQCRTFRDTAGALCTCCRRRSARSTGMFCGSGRCPL